MDTDEHYICVVEGVWSDGSVWSAGTSLRGSGLFRQTHETCLEAGKETDHSTTALWRQKRTAEGYVKPVPQEPNQGFEDRDEDDHVDDWARVETERLPESDDGAGDESNTETSHQFHSDSGSEWCSNESAGSKSWSESSSDSGSESTSASRFTEEERTSMALFSFIARHRLSNEAGKDLLELLKVVKTGDET